MTSSFFRRILVLVALVGVAHAANNAQGRVTQAVDFVAVSADGSPVTNLTADQITIKVDGKERAVSSLELVRYDAPNSVLPAPFATNAAADAGRDFVVVIDEESMAPGTENPVRHALMLFAEALPARDRAGFFTVPRGSQSLAPTTDRGAFRTAVTALQGRKPASNTSRTGSSAQANSGCHGRDVLTALSSIVTATSRPVGPTPVVLFSVAIAAPDTAVAERVASPVQGLAVLESQACRLTQREFQVLGQAVDSGRSQFFVVRPEEGDMAGASEGLESVVGVTGGRMLGLGRATDDAMARITKETAAYYVATFAVEDSERNGLSHRLELKSTRPEVTVRSRLNLMMAKAGSAMTPQNMLRTAAVQTGFGLRSLVVASRNDGDAKNAVKLFGLAEPSDPSVKVTSAAAGVYDSAGKLVGQWTAKPEELQRMPFAAALVVPTGIYRVRMAAVDAQGRAATSDYDINTELVSAGVASLGGLLIGSSAPSFAPQLLFSKEPEVVAYFELYGRPDGQFEAIVELADTVDGKAIVSVPPTPAATAVPDKFMFTAKLPIASLKPGDYVVRARITFQGQPTGVLMRTIRKQ